MRLLNIATTALVACVAVTTAQAAAWPPKAVKIVVPFAAGATPDIVARLLADGFKRQFPDSIFVVDNKPGASGNIGTEAVARAAADGTTIGVSIGGPLATNKLLFRHLGYDPAKDLAAVTQIATQSSALVVSTALGVDNVADLIKLLAQNPGKYTFASIGVGSVSHLAVEAIAMKANSRLAHVPMTSSAAAVMEVVRGDAQITCLPAIAVEPQLATGKLKILAVASPQRSPFLPDTPTLQESGVDVEAATWLGLVAPSGVLAADIQKLHDAAVAVIDGPEFKSKLRALQMEPVGNTPEQFREIIASEIGRWGPVISAANIHLD